MKLFRFERARTRLAISGALFSALFLSVLAWGTRTSVRSRTFADIDDELYTLAIALGSSFELEGLEESKRDTLKAGLEANAFEFRRHRIDIRALEVRNDAHDNRIRGSRTP